jgi:hypothetical protein
MSRLKVIITTHDAFNWSLQPFMYLFNTYWSAQQKVEIVGENRPKFRLESNFSFHSVDVDGQGWPKEKWTNGFIKYLNSIKEQYLVILLNDYWINRTVDIRGVITLYEYMVAHPRVLRMDLTMDRLFAAGAHYPHYDEGNYGHYGHYDLINRPGTQYQISLQPAIWNKKLLLEILQPDWSPWEVELQGTPKVNERDDIIVLGTRQNLFSYTNGLKNEADNINTKGIPQEHLQVIKKWFPK